jgi:hypothetical protein
VHAKTEALSYGARLPSFCVGDRHHHLLPEPRRSLWHLLDHGSERTQFLLHPLNALEQEPPRTRLAVLGELKERQHLAGIARIRQLFSSLTSACHRRVPPVVPVPSATPWLADPQLDDHRAVVRDLIPDRFIALAVGDVAEGGAIDLGL